MNVVRIEAGLRHRIGHLEMRIDALLAQDGDGRAARAHSRRGHGGAIHFERQVQVQARVGRIADTGMLGIGRGRVVALPRDAPADLVPLRQQIAKRRAELALRIAPDLDHAA